MGPKPAGPLPGTGKPGAAPLPGMGKPGAAPLPGMGKPGAAGLPGLGARRPGVTPFSKPQPEKPAAPKGPSVEQIRRDPFASYSAASGDPYAGAPSLIVAGYDEKEVAAAVPKAKLTQRQKLAGAGIAVALLVLGFGGGSMVAGRVEEAMMVRDARIVQYEIDKLVAKFNEVDGILMTAFQNAQAKKFDKSYMAVLSEKLQGNPFNPSLFADRNYKGFDAATLEAMYAYYDQWTQLYADLGAHFRATDNDEPELKATGAEAEKLATPSYGAVFVRDEEGNGQLIGNIMVVGATVDKDGQKMTRVQSDVGIYGDERQLYNGPSGDAEFSKAAETYFIQIAPQTDGGLLKDATKPHFANYVARLKGITDTLAKMRESQAAVKAAVDKLAAQSAPSLLTGLDVDQDVEQYKVGAAKAAAGIAEEPAEGAAEPAKAE